jgi:hypothetical protein
MAHVGDLRSSTPSRSGFWWIVSYVPPAERPSPSYRIFYCPSNTIRQRRSKESCATFLAVVDSLSYTQKPMKVPCGAGGRSLAKNYHSGLGHLKLRHSSCLTELPVSLRCHLFPSPGCKKSYPSYRLYLLVGR